MVCGPGRDAGALLPRPDSMTMARDTDRKKISEAVRLSGAWTFRAYCDETI